nr:unnamed protein product [Digitaria exilis]CAB3502493.1 unnamed protein product [Digitaria exilis]
MAPPPLPFFSPSPKPPPPPPWLHGPSTQTHSPSPVPAAPPPRDEAAPPKPRHHSPKRAPVRNKTAAKPLTAGVPGGRTRRAVLGIIRSVRSLELSDPPRPVPARDDDGAVPFRLPIEPREWGREAVEKGKPRAVPWAAARDEGLKVALRREKKAREPTRAETELPADELERLRRLARGMGKWARAKKAGITDEVVEDLRREWARGEELAAVRLVEPLRRNMDRAREILEVHDGQVKEEEARLKAVDSLQMISGLSSEESSVGTFREYQDFQAEHAHGNTENSNTIIELEAEKHRLEKELKDQEWKLSILNKKIERSNQALAKLHSSWSPSDQYADIELLTEEEKAMFRRIGRKMDGLVLLGRRGIFDGVVEEIHQHWKHKEVVKVITKQNQARQIMYTANLLEVETGGILIAVEKLGTSHAIILYRGKNYQRPAKSSSSNLLTKREALRRSIEVQRRGSMKYFARERQKSILELKRRLVSIHSL